MSVSIDMTAVRAEQLLFAPSQLAELASALHALVEPDHHPTQTDWIHSMRARIDPDVFDRICAADFLWRTSRADILLPAQPSMDLQSELDALDALDSETWVRSALITSSCGFLSPHNEVGSPLTDPRAAVIVRERALARGQRQLAFVDSVLAQPDQARAEIRLLLEQSSEAFHPVWRQIAEPIAAEARRRQDLLRMHGVAAAIDALSPAVSMDAQRHAIVVDKLQDRSTTAREHGMTFVPSYFGNPHVLIVHTAGWRPVLQYPVHVSPVPDHITALQTVQERIHALDHPMRLRLARSLARGPHTTAELANIWNISAPEASRHLAALKRADLLVVQRNGRYVEYSLDHAAAARLGADLIAALLR